MKSLLPVKASLVLAVIWFASRLSATAMVISSENFGSGLGSWTPGAAQSPDTALLWDAGTQRARQSNPGTDTGQITEMRDIDPGHLGTVMDGERATFTIDFNYSGSVWFLDFYLWDDTESWGTGFQYATQSGAINQLGSFGSMSDSLASPLVANTTYTAVIELEYSGGEWTPTFTLNGESFVGDTDAVTPAGQTVHQQVRTFTFFNMPTNVYYDNAVFEVAPVPEPGGALVFAIAAALLALPRRRSPGGRGALAGRPVTFP